MHTGRFITLEGMDGSGKTTQLQSLTEKLRAQGYTVRVTREPGGCVVSERVRDLLLDPEMSAMDPLTEAYLYAASRAQHVAEVIRPALERGEIVLCDRFIDSSLVYQGIGRGLGMDTVWELNRLAVGDTLPDVTLLLLLDTERSTERLRERVLDRMELAGEAFHKRVNAGYRQLPARFPERIVAIDAGADIDTVFASCYDALRKHL